MKAAVMRANNAPLEIEDLEMLHCGLHQQVLHRVSGSARGTRCSPEGCEREDLAG